MLDQKTSAWVARVGFALGALTLSLGALGCGDDAGDASKAQSARDAGGRTTPRDGGTLSDGGRDPQRDAARPSEPDDETDAAVEPTQGDAAVVIVDPTECKADIAPDVGKLGLETVAGATGLSKLVFAAQPPGSSDWYFLEQGGAIRVLSGGALKPTPFLNLSAMISLMNIPGIDDERGLLGLAFAPDYADSGLFYVMLTPSDNRDTVLEFKRSSANPLVADATATKELLKLPASAFNHNSGNLAFGPDGMLYVGTGDGGGTCNDNQSGAPQDPKKLFGKILRLDPKAVAPYGAAGNPFADGSKGDARVWHYGLRNPYRFAFDSDNGDLYIGDVGQDVMEEVDFAASGSKGLNFGWAAFEGSEEDTCGGKPLAAGSTATAPIFTADRRRGQTGPYADWISVIGGQVYRGSALPQLVGVYLFGDYRGDRMVALKQCGDTTSPVTPILKKADPNQKLAAFKPVAGTPALTDLTAIVRDNAGELYFVANRNTLLKVVPGT